MLYLIVFILMFILELLYFRIADKYNIIDKPNERSSHTQITLRGGGVIFYFGALIYFLVSGFQYPWFFCGLTLMFIVSFLDDIYTISNKVRLLIHFCSVLLMAYQLAIFNLPWYYLIITFVVIVGVINACNFMDGINGMTACYSAAVLLLLIYLNHENEFVDPRLLLFVLIAILVFAFFNVRIKAKAFAGDVGSVSIAYILLFALGSLILKTGNVSYILFLGVYGVDAVWTIIRRLSLRENIFEAHRSHLYQYLGNEAGLNKLIVSFAYAIIQFFVGILVISVSFLSSSFQLIFTLGVVLLLSVIYILIKQYVIKKFVLK